MKIQEANTVISETNEKIRANTELTVEEKLRYQQALDFVDSVNETAKEFAKTQTPGLSVDEKIQAALGDKKTRFLTPGRRLAAEVLGGIAIATISVFGGMRLERSRSNKRNGNLLDGLGMGGNQMGDGVGQHHVDSPQSHPAESPDDGRLAQNRDNNQRGRQRAGANA